MRNRKLFHNAKPTRSAHSVTPHHPCQFGNEMLWRENEWSNANGKANENPHQDLERWHWKKVLAAMADS